MPEPARSPVPLSLSTMNLSSCIREVSSTRISTQRKQCSRSLHTSTSQRTCSTAALRTTCESRPDHLLHKATHSRRSHVSNTQTCSASQNSDFDLTETPAPAPPSEELPRDDEVRESQNISDLESLSRRWKDINIAVPRLDNPFHAKHLECHHWTFSSNEICFSSFVPPTILNCSCIPWKHHSSAFVIDHLQVLPDSLADAVMDAASATADAIMRSNNKCQVGERGCYEP